MTDQLDERYTEDNRISRRELLKQMACSGLAASGIGALLSACAPKATEAGELELAPAKDTAATSYHLPNERGLWTPMASHAGDLPTGSGRVHIQGVGEFTFEVERVTTQRSDIFKPGHFSLFDVLVYLSERGKITLDYHFDESMDTHVIDSIDSMRGWWHNAHYSAGWFEPNVFRMDMYPYKNNMRILLQSEREQRVKAIHRTFQDEVKRLASSSGEIVIPEVKIRGPSGQLAFQNVAVTPHNVRSDVLQPGVVTALDAILSLAEQGKLSNLQLTWYERIAGADPVDSYWLERINGDTAVGGCGFVYETGPLGFAGFAGTHIHIPADVRVIVSPEYALWFWICLGGAR